MPYTTNQLISEAFYASEVVSREFETVSGSQITDGLQWLNDIITEKVVDHSMIPYETTYISNFVEGQEVYFIENLISIDTLTFYLNNVRFAMKFENRNNYFGRSRAENVKSLPYEWYFERQLGGGNLYIYFKPDRNYPIEIHGIFRLDEANLGEDLIVRFDKFYLTYLRYALADRICAEYAYETPSNVHRQLSKYEAWISKKSRPLDLTINKVSSLGKNDGYNWGFINLSNGFVKPG